MIISAVKILDFMIHFLLLLNCWFTALSFSDRQTADQLLLLSAVARFDEWQASCRDVGKSFFYRVNAATLFINRHSALFSESFRRDPKQVADYACGEIAASHSRALSRHIRW
ncbi:MAG: hypothetical protein AB7U82_14475 [Blastocatellales bacterium]